MQCPYCQNETNEKDFCSTCGRPLPKEIPVEN